MRGDLPRDEAVTVREARREDVPRVAQLSAELAEVLRRAGNPVGAALSAAEIEEEGFGDARAFTVLVAEAEGVVVGYLLCHPAYDPDLGGRVVTVVDLYVTDRVRRRGIGRALMDAALEHCRQVGAHGLVWWVRVANRDAVAFYERLGGSSVSGLSRMHLTVAS
jgi:GNAT superfamily N-acetyltransferase